MRCKVLVLTHGNLAEAFVHAVNLIYGEVPQLAFKNMPEQLDIVQYRQEIEACVRENEATGILVVTDLLGGTPFLSCMQIIQNNWDKMEIITGCNLPMLLAVAGDIETADIQELKKTAIEAGGGGIVDLKSQLKEVKAG